MWCTQECEIERQNSEVDLVTEAWHRVQELACSRLCSYKKKHDKVPFYEPRRTFSDTRNTSFGSNKLRQVRLLYFFNVCVLFPGICVKFSMMFVALFGRIKKACIS